MKKLYKYRCFNNYTCDSLSSSTIYYACPTKFNDPFDCNPAIINDLDSNELIQLCSTLSTKLYDNDYWYRKQKELIDLVNFHIDEYIEDGNTVHREEVFPKTITKYYVEEARKYINIFMKEKGVLSLSDTWNSIIMWSYYSDSHRGICIEYDLNSNKTKKMSKVVYDSERVLNFSDFYNWILNDLEDAKNKIYEKYYLAKSDEWKHEGEYRDYTEKPGVYCSPYDISAIYFGAKCPESVITMISSLFHKCELNVKLYKIEISSDNYNLCRKEISEDEIIWRKPSSSAAVMFQDPPIGNR